MLVVCKCRNAGEELSHQSLLWPLQKFIQQCCLVAAAAVLRVEYRAVLRVEYC